MIQSLVHRHPLFGVHKDPANEFINLWRHKVMTSWVSREEAPKYLSKWFVSTLQFTCYQMKWALVHLYYWTMRRSTDLNRISGEVNLVSHEVFGKFGSSVVNSKLHKLLKNSFVQHCLRDTTEWTSVSNIPARTSISNPSAPTDCHLFLVMLALRICRYIYNTLSFTVDPSAISNSLLHLQLKSFSLGFTFSSHLLTISNYFSFPVRVWNCRIQWCYIV